MGGCGSAFTIPTVTYGTTIGQAPPGETSVIRHCEYTDELEQIPLPGVNTLFDMMAHSCQQYGDRPMLGTRADDIYHWKTYASVREAASALGSALVSLGLAPSEDHDGRSHSFIGIYGKNREEWILSDIACYSYSICSVPFYDTLGPEAMEYILEQTHLHTIILARENLPKALQLCSDGRNAAVENLLLFEPATAEEKRDAKNLRLKLYDMEELIEFGRKEQVPFKVPEPDDLYTICYTSGTTGFPKGVMLSHRNVVANITGILHASNPQPSDVHISYLPLAHIYERIVINGIFHRGASAGFYNGDVLKLKEDLALLRPTIMPSVPRLLNRFYDVIHAKFAALKGPKGKLVQKAVAAKLENLARCASTTHRLYDPLVFKQIKEVLGGRVRISVTASAPMAGDVLNFLKIAFCCPILEAYGQTECGGAATATVPEDPSWGHVGGPLSPFELKLVDIPEMNYTVLDVGEDYSQTPRGEICFRGPAVFQGYFKLPEMTQETLDSEGWLHSGDVGMFLPNFALQIIDRKKNIFKLAQGEYVAPEKIENVYGKSRYVALIFVHGDSLQHYLVGIVVPERAVCEEWATGQGLNETWEDLCQNRELKDLILQDMTRLGKEAGLHGFEQLKKLYLYPEMLTIESGLLTPTFKVKRFDARKFFGEVIEFLYSES